MTKFLSGPPILDITRCLTFCSLLMLCACGGGGGGGNTTPGDNSGTTAPPASGGGSDTNAGTDTSTTFNGGISGSGFVRSRIQGFGSVIVNGDAYDTSTTQFIVDGDENATQADLDIGKVISLNADFENVRAETIEYRASLKGPITSLNITDPLNGESVIVALGQQVLTNAGTHFQNTGLSTLLVGDLVEISGVRDENENIIAGFVEKKAQLNVYSLFGTIRNITLTHFDIGMLSVDYSGASLSEFENNTPQDGQLVEIKAQSSDFTPPDQLLASELEFIPQTSVANDDRLEIEGIVTRFVDEFDFDISGLAITISESETTFINGTRENLALGVYLEAEGGVNASGTMEAVEITFKPTNAVRVEGLIESVNTQTNSITALGVLFTLRDSTQLEDESDADLDPLTLSDLVVGDRVKIRAVRDGLALIASKIEREEFEDKAELRGPVTAFDEAAGTVSILDIPLTTDTQTSYETEEEDLETAVSQAEFFAALKLGDILEAKWEPFISIDSAVDVLEIEDE